MTTKTKFVAALTALTLTATFALPSNEAQARGRGWGIAAGVIGAGIIAGSIAAAHAEPVIVVAPRRCKFVDRFDHFGNYRGTVRICRY